MRLERLSQDKIRIFLSFDDLLERGIEKEDMWRDIPKVHELFNDMMEQAYNELGFEVTGPVAVEVFALPAQGMVVIVTRGKNASIYEDDADMNDDEVYELDFTLEEDDTIVYTFPEIDPLIDLAHRLSPLLIDGGSLYVYKNRYHLIIKELDIDDERWDQIEALLSEYGDPSEETCHVIEEYGKAIIEDDAIKVLLEHFN